MDYRMQRQEGCESLHLKLLILKVFRMIVVIFRGYREYNVTTYLADRGITILGNLEMSKYWNASFLADSVDNLSKICRVILPLLGNQLSDYVLFLDAMNTTGHLTPEYSILIVFWDYQVWRIRDAKCMDNLSVYLL
ncbi:unnamed protein product [Cylicostephanus goldi]|uniref:Uncharacterized protein n=1 Tax=Cylicostephanus goldi TaxID=71465 RepID=A0A3P6U5L9_CYLGO|nr:unnamed protein product [Cylicostephanus goldi]